MWDPCTGAPKEKIDLDLEWIRGLAFSPDGRSFAAGKPGPREGMIGIWDTSSRRRVYKLPGHAVRDFGRFTILGFSADSRFLLSWGDNYFLRKWDMKTGKTVLEKQAVPAGEKVPELDEDGQTRPFFESGSQDAAFTPRADQLLVLDQAGVLHYLDVASGKDGRVVRIGQGNDFGATLSMSPTGAHVATLGTVQATNRLELSVCGLASGTVLFRVPVPGRYGHAAFSPDGRTVAAAGGENVVLVEVATGKVCLEIPARSRRVTFSPDGRFLVTALLDTTALVWDLAALANRSKK